MIVLVAFNIKEINSVAYSKRKTTAGAIMAFRVMLENPDIDFISVRNIRED